MAHPLFSDNVKKGTPEHRTAVLTATALVFALGAIGGIILGIRINSAEQAQVRSLELAKERALDPNYGPKPGQPGYKPTPPGQRQQRP